jgi:hypothetical protein
MAGNEISASPTGEDVLAEIVGSQLSAVTFVMDYVQLAFDGPQLTAVTCPVIEAGGRHFRWGDLGYRDELCARIAKVVTSVRVLPEAIRICFDDGSAVTISLSAKDLSGNSAESAVFDGSRTVVFQPCA